ncbi:MAG: TRAP transporter small permease subunit [Hyphomicrobiales bacterium]
MKELLGTIAAQLHAVLPGWMVLPNLTFVLPHAGYWLGLLFFPLIAMYLVHRAENRPEERISPTIAYLLWLWGGFVGLHRFYVRSLVPGLVYVALFVLILVGNNYATQARNIKSGFDNDLKIAEFMVTRQQKDVDRGRESAKPKLETANKVRDQALQKTVTANRKLASWRSLVGFIFAVILLMLLMDAILIPRLAKRCAALESGIEREPEIEIMERGSKLDARHEISTPAIRFIERTSSAVGQFVAYWSVLAVFVYYYEVVARYVFNSPTNWAHESMFLMFGMQYLLSGAYAFKENAHVRVDVIYEKFSVRTKAYIDIATSVVFFIFASTLVVTGFLFAKDAFAVREVSFTEWAIQYWPVKMTIVIGGVLLFMQGLAKLMRDIIFVVRTGQA